MRVLLVSHEFPPIGGGGVQRIVKFARYLPAHGIEPVVLTTRNAIGRARDESLLARNGLGALAVERAGGERADAWLRRRESGEGPLPWRDLPALAWSTLRHGDLYGTWFDSLRAQLPALAARQRIDVVWTTVPQYSTARIGQALARGPGLPWVLDVRDAMVGKADADAGSLVGRLQSARLRALEREFVTGADRVVTVSQGIVDNTVARLGEALRPRFEVIENGFDPADLPPPQGAANDKLTLVYAGTFYGRRSPRTLVEGINRAIASGQLDPGLLRLHFYGRHDAAVGTLLDALHPAVECRRHGFVSHELALTATRDADVALLITVPGDDAAAREVLTGKLFECMGLRTFLLALTDATPLRELVRESGVGESCGAVDVDAVAAALVALQRRWKRDGVITAAINAGVVARFDRQAQAGRLAVLLREAVATRRGGRA